MKRTVRFALSLAAIGACGAALRLHALGRHGLWLDEIAAVLRAGDNFGQVLDPRVGHPPLYYLLLSGWLQWGQSESWVRGLSVACGLACLPIVYLLGREAGGPYVGRLALFFAAFSPIQVWVSREGRSYAMMNLLVLASVWFWTQMRRKGGSSVMALGLCAAGALYTHYYAVFGLAAIALAALGAGDLHSPSIRRRLVGAGTLAVVLFLPRLQVLLGGSGGLSEYADEVFRFAARNTNFFKTSLYLLARSDPAHLLGSAAESLELGRTFTWLSVGMLGAILWGAWLGRHKCPEFDGRVWLVLTTAPVLLAAAANTWAHLFLDARYLTQTSLFLAVPAAVAVAALRPASRLGVLLLAATSASVAVQTQYTHPRSEIREAIHEIDRLSRAGDCVVTLWNKAHCYRYYSKASLPVFDLPHVPGLARAIARSSPLQEQGVQAGDIGAIVAELRRCDRVWLLLNDTTVWGVDMGSRTLEQGLATSGFVLVQERAFADTVVRAYTSRPAP